MAGRSAESSPARSRARSMGSVAAQGADGRLGTVGIEEAARQVGVSPSAIRAWERQALVSPLRTPGGIRRYRHRDVERLRAIRAWRTVDGLNAAGIRRLLDADGESGVRGGTMGGEVRVFTAPGSSGGKDAPAREGAGVGDDARSRQPDAPPISERLRDARLARGLTLREAAERSGLSASFVSAVERGISGASVSALRRLLDAYGTTLAELLAGSGDLPRGRLVPASARHAAEAAPGVRIENLTAASRLLEPQLFVLAPGASSNGSYSHPGEEVMYVLDGALGVWLEPTDESFVLGPGDSLTFPSTLEHRFEALGAAETRVIWVNTPPTF